MIYSLLIGGSPVDECTDGLMSLNRIDAVLDKYMYGSLVYTVNAGFQAIFPGVNFTCSGSIQSWTFGATMDSCNRSREMICSYNGKTEEESQDFTNGFARINFCICNEIHKNYIDCIILCYRPI